jgi:hypothetical protein
MHIFDFLSRVWWIDIIGILKQNFSIPIGMSLKWRRISMIDLSTGGTQDFFAVLRPDTLEGKADFLLLAVIVLVTIKLLPKQNEEENSYPSQTSQLAREFAAASCTVSEGRAWAVAICVALAFGLIGVNKFFHMMPDSWAGVLFLVFLGGAIHIGTKTPTA